MILATGVDMVDVRRIEAAFARYGARFAERIYTQQERAYAESANHARRRLQRYASRYAAKEAVMKALSTRGKGIQWRDIEVVRSENGQPSIRLHGAALALITSESSQLHVSLSDEWPYALAFVVVSAVN